MSRTDQKPERTEKWGNAEFLRTSADDMPPRDFIMAMATVLGGPFRQNELTARSKFSGRQIKNEIKKLISEGHLERVKQEIGAEDYAAGRFPEAIELFRSLSTADDLEPFLTLSAYKLIE